MLCEFPSILVLFWFSDRLFALPEYALGTFTPRNLNQGLVFDYLGSHEARVVEGYSFSLQLIA
jgi:hypothetical protein